MPDYAMTVTLPKKRYGDIVTLDDTDVREAIYKMLHEIPRQATSCSIKCQILHEKGE
jgi:hypothetical protein